MTDFPFPFGGAGPGGFSPDDLAGKIPLFAELQKLLSWSGGPVNWDLARQVAISAVAGEHRAVTDTERDASIEALRLADLWLDDATTLPSGARSAQAWSRVEWIERTQPVWATLCEPVAARVVATMSDAIPAEVREQAGPLASVVGQLGGMMFGVQIGQGLAALAQEVVSGTDIGLPLAPAGVAALVPANVAAFGAGLARPDEEVRLYLALREAAHLRLFGHVPWLRQRLLDTIDAYARGIGLDTSAMERLVANIDPTNPQGIQEAFARGMFAPEQTPAQQAALRRLETLLALVEGWVDTVVATASRDRMPGAAALRETSRRRRATGGPAEQTFATLVGLQLRPRRLRDAAALWWAVGEKHGTAGRDSVWGHPDLLPDAEDLDDPIGFAQKFGADPLSDALGELPRLGPDGPDGTAGGSGAAGAADPLGTASTAGTADPVPPPDDGEASGG
ncbi:MAG: zinc-dependent metalloprotease [Actinomycetia bacterium]|nr:zinc-dependent metalloprotease [Actinomycetes bacterium]